MNFNELDALIRQALPDGQDRRDILTCIHDLQEALNVFLGYILAVTGHTFDEDTDSWSKAKTIKRNVNSAL